MRDARRMNASSRSACARCGAVLLTHKRFKTDRGEAKCIDPSPLRLLQVPLMAAIDRISSSGTYTCRP